MTDDPDTHPPVDARPAFSVTLDLTFIAEKHADAMEYAADLLEKAADDPGFLSGEATVPVDPVEFFDD